MARAFVNADTYPHASTSNEYMVYIYHRPENQIEGQSDWEMRARSDDFKIALSEARRLLDSRSFKKIEIKQRTRHALTNKVYEHTLKVLQSPARSWLARLYAGMW